MKPISAYKQNSANSTLSTLVSEPNSDLTSFVELSMLNASSGMSKASQLLY